MKSRWDEVKSEERRCSSAKVRRKKIHPRQMLEKLRNAVFFQWFVCRVSRKVGLLKRRVRSHVVRGEIKNCTPLWRKAHVEVNMYKTRQVRSTFWSYDAENWRRCGKKHICKSKCTKHIMFGALFEVLTWKNGTPLWREAHLQVNMLKNSGAGTTFEDPMWKNCTQLWREVPFQVKLYKTHQQRTVFWSSDVEKLHAAVARSTCVSQNVQNTCVLAHFLKFRCRKISQLASSSVNQSVR